MIRRLAVCLAVALAALLGAAPAYADDEIGFSRDGVHWSSALPGPLFPDTARWVPGDVEESSFYVRNQGSTDGQMIVNALTQDAQGIIASDDLLISARIGTGRWVSLAAGKTRLLPAVLDIARRATTRVTVKVELRPSATTAQDAMASFRLRVVLFRSGVIDTHQNNGHGDHPTGDSHASGSGDGYGGALPNTGSDLTTGWIWLAAGLIGSGIALVVPRRRREVDHG